MLLKSILKVVKVFIGLSLGMFMLSSISLCFVDFGPTSIIVLLIWGALGFAFYKYALSDGTFSLGRRETHSKTINEVLLDEYEDLYDNIENGELPDLEVDNLLLRRGEICHYAEAATLITSKTVTTGYQGGSSGISLRVAKGVTVRSGSSRGVPIKGEEVTRHNGALYITNNRVIFASPSKSFNLLISKVSAVNPYSDGVGFCSGNSIYNILMYDPRLVVDILKICVENIEE